MNAMLRELKEPRTIAGLAGQISLGGRAVRGGQASSGGRAGVRPRLGVFLAVHDFPMVAAGLRTTIELESDMMVVAQADGADSMLDAVATSAADIVITECLLLSSSVKSAIDTIESIKRVKREVRVLVLASQASSEHFSLALKAGADGFLTREAQPADVVSAIRCIARGQTYVSPEIVTRMMSSYFNHSRSAVEDPYDLLSEREREVLLLVAAGLTNREIAEIVHLSEQTVHNNRARLMEKLGFHDRVELLKYAIRRRLIDVGDL